MSSVNKVILVGNLGRDPELRQVGQSGQVCNFSIATTEMWKDRDGNKQEKTEWHRISCWGQLATICNEHLRKGRQVYVEGSLTTREWTDKDGNKQRSTEVKADQVVFLGDRQQGGGNRERSDREESAPPPPPPPPPPRQPAQGSLPNPPPRYPNDPAWMHEEL